jgi:hypothetical protein
VVFQVKDRVLLPTSFQLASYILELKIARGHLALEVARRHFNRDTLWSQN